MCSLGSASGPSMEAFLNEIKRRHSVCALAYAASKTHLGLCKREVLLLFHLERCTMKRHTLFYQSFKFVWKIPRIPVLFSVGKTKIKHQCL